MPDDSVNNTRSGNIATGIKTVGMVGGVGRMIRNLVGAVLLTALMVFLMTQRIPAWFCILVIVMMWGFVVLDIVGLRRTARVNLEELNEPEPVEVNLEPGEKPVMWVPGVLPIWKSRGYSVLGTGKVANPQNALLLSSRGVWELTVPLPGVDKIVSGTDIGKWQWLTAWRDIEEKLMEILRGNGLEGTLRECRARRVCALEEIKSIEFSERSQGITIKLQNPKSYTYSIRDQGVFQRARETFPTKL